MPDPYLRRFPREQLPEAMRGLWDTAMADRDEAAAELFWRRLLAGLSEPTPLRFARPAGAAEDRGRLPAALVLAKILIPEVGQPETTGQTSLETEKTTSNLIEAAATGASDGLQLALNVGAMLIAFIALIALANTFLGWGAGLFGLELTLQQLLGWTLAPFAWLIGVPWADAVQFGSLVGTKVVVNEFIAYLDLGTMITAGDLSPKTVIMATFALCGFANFSSIAIQIGGIGPLAPSRKVELAQLGLKAVLAATLANMMTATIAGVLAV